MATKKQLRERWKRPPGDKIIENIYALGIIHAGHGHVAEDLFALLDGLPYRDEVPNGRDLRAMNIGGRGLYFLETDFSYCQLNSFFFCDLSRSSFEGCTGERISIHNAAASCSFRAANLRSCYFRDADLSNCTFDGAKLRGCMFQNANLAGSSFVNADCRDAAYAKATLFGCDFRGAKLDGARFEEVRLDKTTDFRGASLVNVLCEDRRDSNGIIIARGCDLTHGCMDSTTKF